MKSRVGSLLKLSAAATALSFALGSAPVFAADNGDVIVVTGSRIARPELKAAVPIEVVSAQSISATGTTNIQDALKDLPSVVKALIEQARIFRIREMLKRLSIFATSVARAHLF